MCLYEKCVEKTYSVIETHLLGFDFYQMIGHKGLFEIYFILECGFDVFVRVCACVFA